MYVGTGNLTHIGKTAGNQCWNHQAVQAVVTVIAKQDRIFRLQVHDIAKFMLTQVNDFLTCDALDLRLINAALDVHRAKAVRATNQTVKKLCLVDQFFDLNALAGSSKQNSTAGSAKDGVKKDKKKKKKKSKSRKGSSKGKVDMSN